MQKELQSLRSNGETNTADGEGKYRRNKSMQGNIAKNKTDALDRIFQAFADLIYFLEFIEDNHELHDIFEKDLKDLFGVTIDPNTQRYHHQNRGGGFARLIRASLFIDSGLGKRSDLDFRIHLINFLIECATDAMRFYVDTNEENLMNLSVPGAVLWSRLISSRGKKVTERPRRGIGFYSYK